MCKKEVHQVSTRGQQRSGEVAALGVKSPAGLPVASSAFWEPDPGGRLQATTSPPPRSNQAHHHDLTHANQRKLPSSGGLQPLVKLWLAKCVELGVDFSVHLPMCYGLPWWLRW